MKPIDHYRGENNLNQIRKIISIVLMISMLFSLASCGKSARTATLSDPNEQSVAENIQTENIITENELHEFITSEIYLEEIVIVENKITEMLLEEDSISEVKICSTVYVPQDHIEEFAKNSQAAQLFGEDFDISSVLTKVAIGTGVIVTLVVLKPAGPQKSLIADIVVAAAKFAEGGAAVGSLFGGLIGGVTGATDIIDESGRTSAVIGFAAAVVGMIFTTIHLVGLIPSGGTSAIGVGLGIRLVIAGVSVVAATSGTAYAGYNAVKAVTATDSADIDWGNIDWNAVGVSSAEKAIQYGADGYMWGSIYGAIDGGAQGYDNFYRHYAPYTSLDSRLGRVPKEGNGGHWTGKPGESDFILDSPLFDQHGNKITRVPYRNAVPDFSDYALAEVKIPNMTNNRTNSGGNYEQANEALAEYWSRIRHNGRTWTARDVESFRTKNNLTWHEMSNMETMQLVPYDVNRVFTHYGGVAEYNAMIGQQGGEIFD